MAEAAYGKSEWRPAKWQSGLVSYYNLRHVNTWILEHFNGPKRDGKEKIKTFPLNTSSGETYDIL
jgi:hypothetical protein